MLCITFEGKKFFKGSLFDCVRELAQSYPDFTVRAYYAAGYRIERY